VDDAAAGGHPLHAAVFQQAFVAGAVAVAHAAGEHVGDGLEAAVRVVGEAADVVAGLVGAEGVEHQEGVEPALQGCVSTRVSLTPAPSLVGWPAPGARRGAGG
jgi:hypothetical protein